MERTEELEDQVRSLTRTVDEMRARLDAVEAGEPKHVNGSKPSSRRGFLRLGAAAALGAVGMAATKVLPAAAANSGTFVLGQANTAESPTTVQGDAAGGIGPPVQVLAAVDSTFSGSALATAGGFTGTLQGLGPLNTLNNPVEGVDGWAQGSRSFGVYGLTDAGTGVVGEASTGIGLYARRSGRLRQDGLTNPGAPTYTPNLYEQIRDSNGILWLHNASANWRRVNTLRTDTADGLGNAFKPLRLADTRNGTGGVTGPVSGGSTKVFQIAGGGTGASAIPLDAVAIVGNLTAVGWNVNGWLTIFPAGTAYNPNADPSSMNFSGGAYAWANSFVVGLGTGGLPWGGKVAIYVGTLGSGSTNFILDITGYIQ
jgi:hypothetical protein